MGADGELTPDQERSLELHLETVPADAARIEAETKLREAVDRVASSGPATPAGLYDRVAAALADLKVAEFDPDLVRPSASAPAPTTQDLPGRLAPLTRDRSFWTRVSPWNLTAAAAVLALGAVATVLLLSKPQSLPEQMVASRTAAVQFVAREHGRCFLDLAPGAEKFRLTSSAGLPEFAADVIGREVALADLLASGAENLRFIDAGPCGVPRGGRSMHLRFEMPIAGEPEPTAVSLFVQRYTGEQGLDEGTTYALDPAAGADLELKSPTVYTWLRDGLVYYLVIDDAKACSTARQEMAAPERIRPLAGAA